ncbi:9733_t:CDS:2, partial [Dentiscutata erythropus]
MPYDSILTRSKANEDNLKNSNKLDNFKGAQKIENSNIEIHNSLSQHNEEDFSTINENILFLIRSNKRSSLSFLYFHHILLDIFKILSSHTGQAISNIILSLLDEYKLENKILILTSDNASNVILASNLVKTMLA